MFGMEHAKFIDSLGGSNAVAAALRLSQNTVGNWKKRGVPWRYRPTLERMAERQGVAVPPDFIADKPDIERQESAA
jgi:hypothetical protein